MQPGKANNKEWYSGKVGEKEKRKLKSQFHDKRSAWSGLGMVGIIGWSVVVPALLGTALGTWLDKKHPQSFSWTISFLLMGLVTGCIIAWHWIDKESKEMNQKQENDE